jgi:hypothetical protein
LSLAWAGALIVLLILAAVALLVARTRFPAWGYIASIFMASGGLLLVRDIAFGHHSSTITRYLAPIEVWVELAAAFAVVELVRSRAVIFKAAGVTAGALLIGAGMASTFASTRVPAWWDNNKDAPIPALAREINAHEHPVVVSHHLDLTLALINVLNPDVRILFPGTLQVASDAAAQPDSYVLAPSPQLREHYADDRARALVPIVEPPAQTAAITSFRSKLNTATNGHSLDGDELAPGAASLWKLEPVPETRRSP